MIPLGREVEVVEGTAVDVIEVRVMVGVVCVALRKDVLMSTSPVPDDEDELVEDTLEEDTPGVVVELLELSSLGLLDDDGASVALVLVVVLSDDISVEEVILEEVVLVLREVFIFTAPVPDDELSVIDEEDEFISPTQSLSVLGSTCVIVTGVQSAGVDASS